MSASGDLARSVADIHAARVQRELAIEGTRELAELMAEPDPIPERYVITEPGIYPDVPAATYHRDPIPGGSLSSTGARKLLEPGGPAKYRYLLDNPPEPTTDAFDFGRAAHQVVLGDPENQIVVVDADNWRTKAAQAAADDARAQGLTPILTKQWEVVQAMAEAIQAHPVAAGLLTSGKPEQTIVWQDSDTGVWCRARIDWFRTPVKGRRLLVVDYKSAADASDDGFSKAAAAYGYHQQDQFYRAGVRALGIDEDPAFLFVVQDKKPPYLVNVIELNEESQTIGRNLNQIALHLFKECRETGNWPGYGREVSHVSLPYWYLKQHDEEPTA